MQLTEIRLAGFGGQGVILSAIVLGKAASIFQGSYATMTQNFGPEARNYKSAGLMLYALPRASSGKRVTRVTPEGMVGNDRAFMTMEEV
jgi:Pyruvate/2-oxoacid:ferredoxin oxidoreductase gamma subunit